MDGVGAWAMRTLETARLRLEPLRADHAEAMFVGLANARLYEFLAEEPPASVGVLRERYARLESRRSPAGDASWLNWVAVAKATSAASGYVQSTVTGLTANIAYVFFERVWGQGLAREAVNAMLAELRDAYRARTAVATVDPRNHRSVRLLEQLGFSLAETRPGVEWVHGVLADEARYSLELSDRDGGSGRVGSEDA